jgi:hypothetical protein
MVRAQLSVQSNGSSTAAHITSASYHNGMPRLPDLHSVPKNTLGFHEANPSLMWRVAREFVRQDCPGEVFSYVRLVLNAISLAPTVLQV